MEKENTVLDSLPDFEYTVESLNEKIKVCVTKEHRFGTDAFLLGSFASPKHKDIVCDLGTGCGIIPLYMSKAFSPKKIYAVDIMEKAIRQLEYSLTISETNTEIDPINIDLKLIDTEIPKASCTIVTCNPPYKTTGSGIISRGYSDKTARHETMCTIYDICEVSAKLLKYGGKLCICQRPERLADVMEAMRASGIEPKRLRFVSKTTDTAPWLFLLEGRKNGGSFLKVEPSLYIQGRDNEFSDELKNIYGLEDKV